LRTRHDTEIGPVTLKKGKSLRVTKFSVITQGTELEERDPNADPDEDWHYVVWGVDR
jgi:hypothetical protein